MTTTTLRWRFVGRLCLDFAMTGGRGQWAHFERFHAPRDLQDWCAEGPLTLRDVHVRPSDVRRAARLREAVQSVAFALVTGRRPSGDDVAVINRFAAASPLTPVLDPTAMRVRYAEPAAMSALLSEVARDAQDLLADAKARERVRQCESPDCALVFYDDSRPGNRRWCSSARCGDRARARAYRARKATRSTATAKEEP